MTTNYPKKWSSILQGNIPKFRHSIEPISIKETIVNGKYMQMECPQDPIWCHIVPLNLHQKQNGILCNFFAIVCNVNIKEFDLCAWNHKYLKISSRLQPINSDLTMHKYGYFFAKEITKHNLLKTMNIHKTIEG